MPWLLTYQDVKDVYERKDTTNVVPEVKEG
jgi:hypothetical protein